MLNCRRIIAGQSAKRRLLSSMPHEKKSGGGILLFPLVVGGGVVGAAYAIEHKFIPDDIANKLSFLSPVQDFLREQGFGSKESGDSETAVETTKPEAVRVEDDSAAVNDDEDSIEPEEVAVVENETDSEEADAGESVEEAAPESVEEAQEVAEDVEESTETPPPQESAPEPPQLNDVVASDKSDVSTETPSPSSTYASDSERLLALRVRALDRTLSDVSSDMAALQSEAELALANDLEEMDEKTLRTRIVQMNAELLERIRWEGVRQQQAVQAAESQFAQEYSSLLSQQRSELLVEAERRMFEKEKEVLKKQHAEVDAIRESYEERLRSALVEQEQRMTSASKSELEKAQAAVSEELSQAYTLQLAQLKESHVKNMLEVQNDVSANNIQLAALRDVVEKEFDKTAVSCDTHAMSAAVLLVERALLAGKNVKSEVEALKTYASDDALVSAVIKALPKSATTTGVPTVGLLKSRFLVVKEETRKAGLAPENAPPLLGQLIGNFLALVSVQPSVPVSGEGIEAILSRASSHVDCGDLAQALEEIDDIQGYPRTMMRDWESMARERLAADQAAQTLKAAAAVKHLQFV